MSPMISVAKEKKIEFEKLNRYLKEKKPTNKNEKLY